MRTMPFRRCGLLLAITLLPACAIDGYEWERTAEVEQVTIRMTEVADVAPLCARYLPGQKVMACAVMRVGYCEIIVPPNAPALVAHEAAHCLGFMHPGDRSVTSGASRLR